MIPPRGIFSSNYSLECLWTGLYQLCTSTHFVHILPCKTAQALSGCTETVSEQKFNNPFTNSRGGFPHECLFFCTRHPVFDNRLLLADLPYSFHFLMIDLTVLREIFSALEIFLYPSPDWYFLIILSRMCLGCFFGFMVSSRQRRI